MFYKENSSKFTKFSKILIALTAFLTILYFLSFIKSCTAKDKREKIKSALVSNYSSYYPSGARPVISIKPSVVIKSGTGSETDPWIIK